MLGGMEELAVRAEDETLVDPKDKTVLIVDDDDSFLTLLEILIRRDGFKIDRASTGQEALRKLKSRPDAVVLDLMLPEMTGCEILRRLRESEEPVPPILVVTAYSGRKEVEEVKRDPNVALFLSKPINQKKLLLALHKVLKTKPASPRPSSA